MLSSMLSALPLLALLAGSASALDASSMRARSVYQVVTDRFALSNDSTTTACSTSARQYCGGTWKGLQSKLDYIQGMGFDTVWISPVVSNIGGTTGEGQSYHGYWSLDVSQLNSNFGAEADLKSLISALHSRGMYIMVDVVINHVAATSNSDFATSSAYGPFSVQDDFHPFCWITDYSNQTMVEQCWLGDTSVALPDLNTESTTVVNYWTNWISQLVSNYTIDAIRIDTAKHIRADFWPGFTAAANVFNVAEILDGDPTYVGPYQKNATLNPFNYPIYYPLLRAFNQTGTSFTELSTMVSSVKSDFSDPTLLGGFTNNADNPRFENYTSDQGLIMNAHAYSIVTDGIPYVYYGSEAGYKGGNDPDNREALWLSGYNTSSTMYGFFKRLNAARQAAGNSSSSFYTSQMNVSSLSTTELLVSKPPLISILSNRGGSSSTSSNLTIPSSSSSWSSGTTVIDAVSCNTFTVGSDGSLSIGITNGQPRVLIDNSKKGTLCSASTTTTGGTSSSSKSAGSITVEGWSKGWVGMGVAGLLGAAVMVFELGML